MNVMLQKEKIENFGSKISYDMLKKVTNISSVTMTCIPRG